MAGTILGAAVGLGLHDAADPAAFLVVTHDEQAQQGPRDVLDRTGQGRAVERHERGRRGGCRGLVGMVRGPRGKGQTMTSRTSGGRIGPRIVPMSGMRCSWMLEPMDESRSDW